MTTTELVAGILLKATGKATTVTQGDTKWNKVVGIANLLIGQWESEPGVDWDSLYDNAYSLGAVTATDTFAIDTDDVRKISQERGDYIRIVHTDGNYTDYELVKGDRLKAYTEGNYCARIGDNLVFNNAFASTDPQYGGTIYVPKYGFATRLSDASSVVPVDDPNWLLVMGAAEYTRTDITRQNQYPNLVAEGNQLMIKMKENNSAQVDTVPSSFMAAGATW